jgi:predicted membrane chloride channel (bestrophin family)
MPCSVASSFTKSVFACDSSDLDERACNDNKQAIAAAETARICCRKLVDTPFPFPWAQAVMIVLIIFTVVSPFLVAAFAKSVPLAIAMNFISVHTMVMLNEVARDVEDPFHYDPNELPLPQIQYRMNERLLAVAKTTRPMAFTDVADLSGPSNIPRVQPVRPSRFGT